MGGLLRELFEAFAHLFVGGGEALLAGLEELDGFGCVFGEEVDVAGGFLHLGEYLFE